jgi:hypothetical protein
VREVSPNGARRWAFDSGSTRSATARPHAAGTPPVHPLKPARSYAPTIPSCYFSLQAPIAVRCERRRSNVTPSGNPKQAEAQRNLRQWKLIAIALSSFPALRCLLRDQERRLLHCLGLLVVDLQARRGRVHDIDSKQVFQCARRRRQTSDNGFASSCGAARQPSTRRSRRPLR